MGLVRTQKVGGGMDITGENEHIKLRVVSIGGTEFNRKVKFKVDRCGGVSELEVSAEQGYVDLTEGIRVEVCNRRDFGTGFVSINYDAVDHYKLMRQEDEKDKRRRSPQKLNVQDYPRRIVNANHPVGYDAGWGRKQPR